MTRRTKIVLGVAVVAVVAAVVIWLGFFRSAVDQKRLIGTWAFVSGGNGWGGTTLTFTEDGKIKSTVRWDRETYDSEGTYTVKGDTLEMFIADYDDWGEEAWDGWNGRGGGGKSGRSNTDTKSQSQPKQQSEPTLHRVTIRSLSETELVVVDERGKKTAYARK